MTAAQVVGCVMALLALGLALAWPFALLWAFNTLFPQLAWPYTWQTWLAACIVIVPLVGMANRSRK